MEFMWQVAKEWWWIWLLAIGVGALPLAWLLTCPSRLRMQEQQQERQEHHYRQLAAMGVMRERSRLLEREYDRPLTQGEIDHYMPIFVKEEMVKFADSEAGKLAYAQVYCQAIREALNARLRRIELDLPPPEPPPRKFS